jgi:hypothetical protein
VIGAHFEGRGSVGGNSIRSFRFRPGARGTASRYCISTTSCRKCRATGAAAATTARAKGHGRLGDSVAGSASVERRKRSICSAELDADAARCLLVAVLGRHPVAHGLLAAKRAHGTAGGQVGAGSIAEASEVSKGNEQGTGACGAG